MHARTPTRRVAARAALVSLIALTACTHAGRDRGSTGGMRGGASHEPSLTLHRVWTWTSPANASAGMPAADADGVVFTAGHHLVVLLDRAGSVRWQVEHIGVRDVAPVLTADVVLVPTDDGVVALDRPTGRQRWAAALGERANTPALVAGRAVVTTWEGSLAALDLADGRVAWKVALGGDALGPAAAAAPASPGASPVVVASFDTGHAAGVAAYDAVTGARRWVSSVPADGVSAPAVVGASVVVVAADAAAHALSLDTGTERWRQPVEGAGSPEVPPLPLADGTVVVAHRQGGLAALGASDGRVRWTAASDGAAVRGGPAGPGPNGWFALPLDDGRVLLGGPDREPDARQPGGLATGVVAGPGGVLVVSSGQGDANGVEAVTGW